MIYPLPRKPDKGSTGCAFERQRSWVARVWSQLSLSVGGSPRPRYSIWRAYQRRDGSKMAKHQGKKPRDRRSGLRSPGRKSITERFTPVLVEWWKARPPKLVQELTFRNVVEYFVSHHPGDPSVQSGALLRMPHPRGHNLFQVFLGPSDELLLDREGQPYGRQFIAMRLDSELSARLQDTDLILFR